MHQHLTEVSAIDGLRAEIAGLDQQVSLLDGICRSYIHLDHAACTPAFRAVVEKMTACLEWYGDGQHGSGHRALATRQIFARAQSAALAFTGADADEDIVYYGKNTSEVLDVLSRCIHWQPGDVVLTTELNALSSELPWQGKAQVVYAGMDSNGSFDLKDLEAKLIKFAGRVKLVAVNGAGALTGAVPPVQAAAELAHHFRAMILAECGQVAAHRAIHKGKPGSLAQIDFVTLSGQKMYAPVGIAALIGGRNHLVKVAKRYGTPNMAGAAALAASMEILSAVGLDAIAAHEAELAGYLRMKLGAIPGCSIAGTDGSAHIAPSLKGDGRGEGLNYLSFSIAGIPAARLAAILAYEAGVGVGRLGGNLPAPAQALWPPVPDQQGQRPLDLSATQPGLARVSFGCYNNTDDVDRLVDGLERAAGGEIRGEYEPGADGRYFPRGFDPFDGETIIQF